MLSLATYLSQRANGSNDSEEFQPIGWDQPFNFEDEESFAIRVTYQQMAVEALKVDAETAIILASLMVKKARYAVVYEESIENLLIQLNQQLVDYYAASS